MKKIIVVLALFVLVGCNPQKTPDESENPSQNEVVNKVNAGDYDMLSPFNISAVRKHHAFVYREIDVVEIGRRLIEKSKDHFSTSSYKISEGSLLNEERYLSLLQYKTSDNPDGLNTRYADGIEVDGSTLIDPVFVTDLYEINFHRTNDSSVIDGVSVAMVLNRIQETDPTTGATVRLSDDALFEIGSSLGLQLSAYLRKLENMSDVPIYIAIYAQDSAMDKLPDNYLPGYYIGDAYSVDNSTKFSRNDEKWMLLSTTSASELFPELASKFSQLKSKIQVFLSEENIGIVGKIFVKDNTVQAMQLEVTTGSKTFTEIYGVGQYISNSLSVFDELGVPITVNVTIFQKTRIVITKRPNQDPIMTVIQ